MEGTTMTAGFRDDDQRLRACRTLLAAGGVEWLWNERGPTDAARGIIAADGHPLSARERALLLAAWAFWSGDSSRLRFAELSGLPEAESIYKLAIATLYGPDAVDAWLIRPDDASFVAFDSPDFHAATAKLFDEARAALAENRGQPLNIASAADACALGAVQMADYTMMLGVRVIEDDAERHAEAIRVAVRVLSTFATLSHRRARAAAMSELASDDGSESEC